MSDKYSFKWSFTVEDININDWQDIYGTDIIKSREFFMANEGAAFEDVDFYYLQVFSGCEIVAIVPCFCYRMDILNIASSPTARKWLALIRKLYPSFLKLRAFVTGSYAATCEHFIEYSSSLDSKGKEEVSEIIGGEIKRLSIKTKSSFVFVKDVRERALQNVRDILTSDYRFFVSFPTTAIPVIADITYPGGLRKKNRKRYRIFKEKFDNSFEWGIISDFSGEKAQEFYSLYKSVLDNAENKFEFLNARFFDLLSQFLEDRAFLLVARDKFSGEIRVMELVLENGDKLIPLYLGIKYKNDDTKILYLNTIFRTVKEAEARGKSYVDFGQTSYYPKIMSGALVENIYYGFWSRKKVLRWMINHLFDRFFSQPVVPGHVYSDKYSETAQNVLYDKGFILID